MARILNVTVGIRSHLNAHLALIDRINELGHECVLCSVSHSIEDEADKAGVSSVSLTPTRGAWERAPYLPGLGIGGAARRYAKSRADAVLSGLGLREELRDGEYDLIIIDAELHEHVLEAYLSGTPTAIMDTHLSVRRRRNVPVLSDSFIPTTGRLSRLRCWLGWEKTLLRRSLGRVARQLLGLGLSEFSVMRRRAAMDGRKLATLVDMRQWPICSFPRIPCLRLTVPEMDFLPSVEDPKQLFLGPMVRRAQARQEDEQLIMDTQRFLATRPAGEPVVLASFGSILSMSARVRTLIDAVTSRPVTLLVGLGTAVETASLVSVPPNVFVARWLPVAHLLPASSVAVCHGGVATIHECIEARVPMLVYSGGVMDQEGNAARVAGLGLGIPGDATDTADDTWRNIELLLRTSDFRTRCAAMRRRFEAYGDLQNIESALSYCFETTD